MLWCAVVKLWCYGVVRCVTSREFSACVWCTALVQRPGSWSRLKTRSHTHTHTHTHTHARTHASTFLCLSMCMVLSRCEFFYVPSYTVYVISNEGSFWQKKRRRGRETRGKKVGLPWGRINPVFVDNWSGDHWSIVICRWLAGNWITSAWVRRRKDTSFCTDLVPCVYRHLFYRFYDLQSANSIKITAATTVILGFIYVCKLRVAITMLYIVV